MKLFIGMGSSDDIPHEYFDKCDILLNRVLKNNDLIFGTYDKGLMGHAYNIAKNNGNKVIGVVPKVYIEDANKLNCDEKIVVDNILERTHDLIKNSDAILFLPGGIGTICEIFGAIDMKRNHEIDVPIVFYNCNNYYDKLFEFLERLYNEKFTVSKIKNSYFISDNIDEIVNYLEEKEG